VGNIDVQYNPDIIHGLLEELSNHLEQKCAQIQKDTEFHTAAIRQAFNMELIRLPNQVKQMSISRFREEFGDSLEAVTKGAMGALSKTSSKSTTSASSAAPATATKSTRSTAVTNASAKGFQTPSQHTRSAANANTVMDTAMKSQRAPKEGERILSENGSPLGDFTTVVKAPRPANSNVLQVPPTPGVFVPLQTGEILDLGSVDVEKLSECVKEDALEKMQIMMKNMQSLMSKLEKPK
jgi:hypothetical protein